MRTVDDLLDELERRRFKPATRQALTGVLAGESYRQVAAANGLDYRDVFKAAKTVPGLQERHLAEWRRLWGSDLPAHWQHHLAHIESTDVAA